MELGGGKMESWREERRKKAELVNKEGSERTEI